MDKRVFRWLCFLSISIFSSVQANPLPKGIVLAPPYYGFGNQEYASADAVLDAGIAAYMSSNNIPADCPVKKESFEPSGPTQYPAPDGTPLAIVASAGPGEGWTYEHCNTFSWSVGAYLRMQAVAPLAPPCAGDGVCVGDPIDVLDHLNFQIEKDYVGGDLNFERYYISTDALPTAHMGARWRHSYDKSLQYMDFGGYSDAGAITATREDGKQYLFVYSGGAWSAQGDLAASLSEIRDPITNKRSGWIYRTDDSVESYTLAGVLTSIRYNNGGTVALTYSDASTPTSQAPISGLLINATDQTGRSIAFYYDSAARVHSMLMPGGASIVYGYDGSSNLATVKYQNRDVKTYIYNESTKISGGVSLPHALTGIVDERSIRYASFYYDSQGGARATELAGGVNA